MSAANHDAKAGSDAPRTLLIKGGQVLVLDGKTPPQEAIVLRNGHVAAVGTAEAMGMVAGPGAEHLDVRGCTVMPGLVDTHSHIGGPAAADGSAPHCTAPAPCCLPGSGLVRVRVHGRR